MLPRAESELSPTVALDTTEIFLLDELVKPKLGKFCSKATVFAYIVKIARLGGQALPSLSELTHILDRAQQGDPKAAEELLPLVYCELRKIAAPKMAVESSWHTLQSGRVKSCKLDPLQSGWSQT